MSELELIKFISAFIFNSKVYKRQYYQAPDVSLQYFKIMCGGDNLERVVSRAD